MNDIDISVLLMLLDLLFDFLDWGGLFISSRQFSRSSRLDIG
jgi:hypothetical protein